MQDSDVKKDISPVPAAAGSDTKQHAVKRRYSKYTLQDLIAQCDLSAPLPEEDKEWLNSPPVGRELI